MRQQLTTFITAVIVRSVYARVDARITVLVLNYQHFRFIPANAVMASLARLKAIAISIYSWVPLKSIAVQGLCLASKHEAWSFRDSVPTSLMAAMLFASRSVEGL